MKTSEVTTKIAGSSELWDDQRIGLQVSMLADITITIYIYYGVGSERCDGQKQKGLQKYQGGGGVKYNTKLQG